MSNRNSRFSATLMSAAIASLTAFAGSSALAAPLDISDTPLFLTSGVEPNLIMAIDDSGSMDFEVLFAGNDGSAWWRTATASGSCPAGTGQTFIGCIANGTTDLPAASRLNFNNAGNADATWKKYTYLFPNGCNTAVTSWQRRNCDATNDHFAIPPLRIFAWSRSPTYNTAYFDPAKTYLPWRSEGGFTFSNATPTAARFDPVFGAATDTIDLTLDRAAQVSVATTATCNNATLGTPLDNHLFKVQAGMVIPLGTCLRVVGAGGSNVRDTWTPLSQTVTVGSTPGNNAIPNDARVAIKYFPATFYLPTGVSPPASFGFTGSTINGTAPDGTAMNGYQIKSGNFAVAADYDRAIQNFANWFSYYRKRHQALRAGLGEAFFDLGGMRVGGFTINSGAVNVTMQDIDDAANRTALYTQFYQSWVRTGGTPNRAAVANVVRNFKRTGAGAPITHSCQKNFGMLFTDGFSNPPAAGDGFDAVGNVDGTAGSPYQDNTSNTLADGVMSAYAGTLRGDLEQNKVPVPPGCSSETPDARLDCNNDPHMNFYAVTLGTRGLQFNPDAIPAQDPYTTVPTWPTGFPARHPSAVDDIWHATLNGRGALLNAKSSDELADKLKSVLISIVAETGSASSASVNSGSISSDTRLFQAKFDSLDWSGELLAFRINADGTLGGEDWNARDELPAAGVRSIITVNSNGAAVPFRWADLDATRRLQIDADPVVGAARVDYLRGDATNEAPNGLDFRPRTYKLGDIISSSPIFVGRPRFGYSDNLESKKYSEFRDANANRNPVVYTGANDGMLHAFDADDGRELLAFIPSPAYRYLATLSNTNYTHRYFVDGAPNMGDAFFGGNWQTVLVGGLNRGGQGVYALNITNQAPTKFVEGNASDLVLWEFTDADDADLGYTYSQPAIVRLQNGKWAAIFGNGYNNTELDGTASGSGNAVLYIVDIASGSLIRKLDTAVGTASPLSNGRPNGMSTPAVVDLNGDETADFVFAGDLFGNMWKVDIRSNNPAAWKFSFGTTAAPLPLFAARDPNDANRPQPITARPEVIKGPRGVGMMVLFGTGKYIETTDKDVNFADPDVQTYYGLFDRNAHNSSGVQAADNRVADLADLVQQEIIDEPTVTFGDRTIKVRTTTQKPLGGAKGWYLNLESPDGFEGERQVSNTVVRNGRVIFTTLIPDADPCGFGGTSWLMELDALSGGRLLETPFDNNNDGVFDERDLVDDNGNPIAVSGQQLDVGITPDPGVLMSEDGTKEFKYNAGTTGEVSVTVENPGRGATGRQSWRQVR
jgi:type IV pilus assembly protein PilY1